MYQKLLQTFSEFLELFRSISALSEGILNILMECVSDDIFSKSGRKKKTSTQDYWIGLSIHGFSEVKFL